jgi:hypothetical protein
MVISMVQHLFVPADPGGRDDGRVLQDGDGVAAVARRVESA